MDELEIVVERDPSLKWDTWWWTVGTTPPVFAMGTAETKEDAEREAREAKEELIRMKGRGFLDGGDEGGLVP